MLHLTGKTMKNIQKKKKRNLTGKDYSFFHPEVSSPAEALGAKTCFLWLQPGTCLRWEPDTRSQGQDRSLKDCALYAEWTSPTDGHHTDTHRLTHACTHSAGGQQGACPSHHWCWVQGRNIPPRLGQHFWRLPHGFALLICITCVFWETRSLDLCKNDLCLVMTRLFHKKNLDFFPTLSANNLYGYSFKKH